MNDYFIQAMKKINKLTELTPTAKQPQCLTCGHKEVCDSQDEDMCSINPEDMSCMNHTCECGETWRDNATSYCCQNCGKMVIGEWV